eukprot:NODE_107_length_18988_cov_0.534491.p13 type:complete len:191 gc:universal NODE_107_length_18988_cov_0.534491:9387-9959(+)
MRLVVGFRDIVIPEEVTVSVKARSVVVKGPRGELKKEFKHIPCEIIKHNSKTIRVRVWHGQRKHLACVRTLCSHIENLITGVTKGFLYKMRLVYAHFPINASVVDGGKTIEIRNFLGEKITRVVPMAPGVKVELSKDQKDELILQGNDVEAVSQSAASIRQSVLVRNKDIRKFLDGIFVSQKTNVVVDQE